MITSKKEISIFIPALEAALQESEEAFIRLLHRKILKEKVRFPILEFLTKALYEIIPEQKQISLLDKIAALDEIGSYVIAGMMLQLRLGNHFTQSFEKAGEYIIAGNEWYVCDIIGERVFGFALLTQPEKTIPVLKKNTKNENSWIVRSVGVATHYAVKKGLKKNFVEEMFLLLLKQASANDFHIKRGIGWGAKTIAKFYPGLISRYEEEISRAEAGTWFLTKIKIGLGRSYKYAARYNS